jgi:predicted MPP superfamily phosphohydrolase
MADNRNMTFGDVQERATSRAKLADRLQPRIAVEQHFAQIGHTYRHGKVFRFFDNHIMRPALKVGLKAVGLYSVGRRNSLSPRIRELVLHFPDLPPNFDGFRLLQLSDFHIDGVDGLAEKLVPLLSGIKSDLCVFTGDYRFEDRGPCRDVYPRMRQVIAAISAQQGIWGILGNHDSAEIAFGLEALGVHMLVNESVEIRRGADSLWLAGVDDPFDYRCADLDTALKDVPDNGFKILLAHAPEVYQTAAARGVHLYLSGHTHAGQIRLPIIGSLKHNSHCPKEFSYGLWKHAGMQGYTTSGVGCSSVPVRFYCPPEIVVFTLKRGGETFEKP